MGALRPEKTEPGPKPICFSLSLSPSWPLLSPCFPFSTQVDSGLPSSAPGWGCPAQPGGGPRIPFGTLRLPHQAIPHPLGALRPFPQQQQQQQLSHFSHVRFCATPWTVARQAPLSMGFSRQEHWSGLPFLPPGGLPDSGLEPVTFMSPALAGGLFATCATREALLSLS